MKRAIIDGKYVEKPTDEQLSANKRFDNNAQYHRDAEREDNYIDLIQPFIGSRPNPEFAKAYPDRAKDYFTEDELKQL
jgi:hypothetical protein